MNPTVKSPSSEKHHHAHRILVVDDSITVRKIVLKALGFKIAADEARSGEEALKLLDSKFYDLIFLDYVLPDLTAAQFLDKLLENTNYAQVPVVLMSSKGTEIARLSEFQENVIETLVKPFPIQAIYKAVEAGLCAKKTATPDLKKNLIGKGAAPSSRARTLLEKGLSRVATHLPALESKRRDQDPQRYYLRYLMHPELLHSFDEFERELQESTPTVNAALRAGRFSAQAAHDLLFDLTAEQRTGLLELVTPQHTLDIHIFKGAVISVSTKDGAAYLAASGIETSVIPEDQLKNSLAEQAKDGRPLLLTLPAQGSGHINLDQHLRDTAEALLAKAFAGKSRYVFRENITAPEWAVQHSLNIHVTDLFLKALRRIHGWTAIGDEIGDLVTRFRNRYVKDSQWILAHLNSFEAMIYDFLKYEYAVTELASMLDQPPSRVAEAVHTLYKLGVVCRADNKKPEHLRIELFNAHKVIALSTDGSLAEFIRNCFKPAEVEVIQCRNTKETITALSESEDIRLIVTDGLTTDAHPLAAIEKIKTEDESTVWLLAEPAKGTAPLEEAIRLRAHAYLPRPFNGMRHKIQLESALMRSLATDVDHKSHFEVVNERISATEARLLQLEKQLQQRENELLRNEEIFFDKCNNFEVERARLDLLQDELGEFPTLLNQS